MFLKRIPYRYLTRHPWQSILMIFGIALGVAVAVAIDLANASASRAFDLSTEAIAGKATHVIVGSSNGVPEELYFHLRKTGYEYDVAYALAPVVSDYVSAPELGDSLLQILGVDPFAEAPFRNYFNLGEVRPSVASLVTFLTLPGALVISTDLAERNRLTIGDLITVDVGGKQTVGFIAELIESQDGLSRQATSNLILVDISTAQEMTGKIGRLDRIDLILPEENDERLIAAIQKELPTGVRIQPVEARSGNIEQMTSAFRINLTALSLLALVVGLFLIYNTITFSIIQRRSLFGTLRCLGVTRTEIFVLVMVEASLVGIVGSAFGLILGIFLGQSAVQLVTRTINDLFFVVSVQGIQIPPTSLVKGLLLGVTATVLTAAPPAWEAASIAPRLALSRSGLENKARSAVGIAAFTGVALFFIGAILLYLPANNLILSFAGTAAVIIGFAMLAPVFTIFMAKIITPVTGKLWGGIGRMAPRNVINSISRTSVATAALMVAVSVTIGVSVMIGSFRYTVIVWLDQILQGDIYLSAPSLTAAQTSAPIDPLVLEMLNRREEIESIYTLRSVTVDSPSGPVHMSVSSNPDAGAAQIFAFLNVPIEELPQEMARGAVVVSEPFANRYGIAGQGASLQVYTDNGLESFPVVGIYYDYSSTLGTVLMSLDVYQEHWNDETITAIALNLIENVDAERLVVSLENQINPIQRLSIRPNRVLRSEVLAVFDRTFAITGALQILATVVAFIGVLSALLSLELERQRELGILRSIGMTARQLWGLILMETGLLGSVAGLLAMPAGYVLALILVYIINQRSFGWTLQMQTIAAPFLQALLLAIAGALLAGIYPAWRMSRMTAADASRFE